jgi:hypothetical protein
MTNTKDNVDYVGAIAENMYLSLVDELVDIHAVTTTWLDKSGEKLSMRISKTWDSK